MIETYTESHRGWVVAATADPYQRLRRDSYKKVA